MPGLFIERQEVVSIFHAKRVILMMSVYSLAIAREKGGNTDSQSQTQKMQIIKQNSPGTDVGMDGTRCFEHVVECNC